MKAPIVVLGVGNSSPFVRAAGAASAPAPEPELAWEWVPTWPAALQRLQHGGADVVLADWAGNGQPDPETMRYLGEAAKRAAVVVLVGKDHLGRADLARSLGACACWSGEELSPALLARQLYWVAAWQRAEQARQRAEAVCQDVFDRFPDGLVVADPAGRLLYANAAARALWRSAGRALGPERFEADLTPGQTAEWQLGAGAGGSVTVESRVVGCPWQGQAARLVFLRDISHRKRNEEQLRVASERYKETIRQLVDRNTEIQLFYHTLSHELKTPLAVAREFVCLVLDGLAGPLTDTQREYLDIARDSCDQLRRHVNDLLDVTRLETGKMSIHRQPVALSALLERVASGLQPEAGRRQIQLTWACEPDLPPVAADSQRLQQVLTNLVGNALKFTPPGGKVRIHAGRSPERPEAELLVGVRDTGPGIPADQRERIFERLQQGETADTRASARGGLGLGLYICREVVRLHGGRIWVDSEPGRGSHFQFTLPVRPAATVTEILVVDDDPAIREFLRGFLDNEGYGVSEAASGAQALERLHQHQPDLVILDLVMPGMDGEETLHEIRRHWPALPVIISSGYAREELLTRLAACAPFAVVEKPYRPEMLLNTIRALLSQGGAARRLPAAATGNSGT